MNESFTKLAQANVDHYLNHPKQHAALIAVSFVGAIVVGHAVARRLAREPIGIRSGQYAK